MQLQNLVSSQVRNHLNIDEKQLDYLSHPSPSHLHDPLYYKDMRELVTHLHQFKKKQEKDPSLLLIVDGDYDTDGVCSAVILNAALSVFGFNYRIYIPTMVDGYGLSANTVDKMMSDYCNDGERIGMILTADNGIRAFSGVSYAKKLGIDVLITDHHPSDGHKIPDAKAVVDPLRKDDLYPFKGNSGATVAWKTMLAYANLFDKDKVELIEQLIVFAGISNIADVMPMQGENRYMVVRAMDIIRGLLKCTSYKDIKDTPYESYNIAFYGLYDLITMLQENKDKKREEAKKKPFPLPTNEELVVWYISPILNAPRRIHSTCFEALCVFMVEDDQVRRLAVEKVLKLNDEKSEIVRRITDALPKDVPNVLCVNAEHGIAGLIAARILELTGKPAVVFSSPNPNNEDIVYKDMPNVGILSGSARSAGAYDLSMILEEMNRQHPGFVKGGGHSGAAGLSINGSDFRRFVTLFNDVAEQVREKVESSQEVVLVPSNTIILTLTKAGLRAEYEIMENDSIKVTNTSLDITTFDKDVMETIAFMDSLRPFGRDFNTAQTRIIFKFDKDVESFQWNPDFWEGKTFKFELWGVACLTFDKDWADTVKTGLELGQTFEADVSLKLNNFRDMITPQFVLTPKK